MNKRGLFRTTTHQRDDQNTVAVDLEENDVRKPSNSAKLESIFGDRKQK